MLQYFAMSRTTSFSPYSFLLTLAVVAVSVYFWGWQSFVSQPEKTYYDRAVKPCTEQLTPNDVTQNAGYPFSLAERKLDCTVAPEESVSGYGDYSIKPYGLLADSIIWLATTTAAAYIINAGYTAYLRKSKTRNK